MQAQSMSPSQIRSAGLAALIKSLGPTGMARFIQQYDMGTGDYTKERSNWIDQMSLDTQFRVLVECGRRTPLRRKSKPMNNRYAFLQGSYIVTQDSCRHYEAKKGWFTDPSGPKNNFSDSGAVYRLRPW